MTELQKLYATLRDAGTAHDDALRELSVTLGVDLETVDRILARAEGRPYKSHKGTKRPQAHPQPR